MKLRFYFDYSDYRSYLMMHALSGLQDLPIQFQWIALDAYSLRALTGCHSHDDCPRECEFMKQEAIRFCRREGIEFVWQKERFHNGSALHVGIWLMIHQSTIFEEYSRKILEILWGEGKSVDSNMLKTILTSLDVDFDEMMKMSSERESFQIQDNCLQQAMSDGVFDVPGVVIGDQIVCHFEHAQEIRRLIMIECFREMAHEDVCSELASLMLSLSKEGCRARFDALMRRTGSEQTSLPAQNQGLGMIQHSLTVPYAIWHIPKKPLVHDLSCHVVSQCRDIQSVLDKSVDHALNICSFCDVEWDGDDSVAIPANCVDFLLAVGVRFHREKTILLLRCENGKLQSSLLGSDEFHTEIFQGWMIAAVSPNAALDLNMARLSAHFGAHLILVQDVKLPALEAYSYFASAWVAGMQENQVMLADSVSHQMMLKPDESYSLNTGFRLANETFWNAPAPRTLLLCEKSLTFGELSAHADIELASLGMNLLVTTRQQASELSPTRVFEKFRIQSDVVLLLPLSNEQIFVPELISHRFLETLNQAPKESYPILVNYWSDLEFEMLEQMRPVLASLATQFKIPVILVVGSQVTEIWLSTPQGSAWRVEKENDCYTIDLDELVRTGQCFDALLKMLHVGESAFIQRLEQIEVQCKKSGLNL